MSSVTAPLALRLWSYQAERFPVVKHGIVIAAFSAAAWALPALATGKAASLWSFIVASVVTFLAFLQLRVADEHKDHAEDCRYRPERPVPRGLVRLKELRGVAISAAVVQAALAVSLDPLLLAPLGIMWTWMALMSAEFFCATAIRARPTLYMLLHMVVTPLIAGFALACAWVGAGSPGLPLSIVAAYLALGFVDGLVLEVARKTWAPTQEREGVETYSKIWGPRTASHVVAFAMLASFALITTVAASAMLARHGNIWSAEFWIIPHVVFVAATALVFAIAGITAARRYQKVLSPTHAGLLERAAGRWVLVSNLLVGAPALLFGVAS